MHDEHRTHANGDVATGNLATGDVATGILATPAPRRDFLQQLLAGGAAVAGAGLLSGCASTATASASGASVQPSAGWDMSWRQKLGRYKTAYDSPEIQNGAALAFAAAVLVGYKEALGAGTSEVTPVLILRHAASVMTLDDAMWKRLNLSETNKLKDPTTGEPTMRNPFIRYTEGDKHSMTGAQAALDTLMAQGAIVLTCNNALRGVASMLRRKETTLTQDAAMAEVRKSVLPGVYVMPNGIFAVSAAQDAGCHYMRVLV